MPEETTTVYIIDDDPATRDYVEALVESIGLHARPCESAADFLETYDRAVSGCVVSDVRMPGMSGLQLQEAMQERDITLPLIILSGVDELQTAVRAMRGGAVDFIQKPCSSQELLDRINEAITQDQASRKGDASSQDVQDAFAALTGRERQVMDCVVEGKANKVIAYDLGISEKTVEVHRGRVMQKLNVGSVAELVRMVLTGQRIVS